MCSSLHRRQFVNTGLAAASYGLCTSSLLPHLAGAQQPQQASADDTLGERELLLGLDGMSRAAIEGRNAFADGHSAAAVMASTFFAREQNLDAQTRQHILAFIRKGLLRNRIYNEPRPPGKADPALLDALVAELENGIGEIRRSGHNIVFVATSLKTIRELPDAATPERIDGLRRMVRSFDKPDRTPPAPDDDPSFVGLDDEKKFVDFIFREYLFALELYLNGKGHHGFAGHVLTVGHAVLDLKRMGYAATAEKAIPAYWQFIHQARRGANRGGKRVADGPENAPAPLAPDYWEGYRDRPPRTIVSSHLIKYPYSYYALAEDLDDEDMKRQLADKLFHLSAVT